MLDGKTGIPRTIIDIEKAATLVRSIWAPGNQINKAVNVKANTSNKKNTLGRALVTKVTIIKIMKSKTSIDQ